MLSFFCPAVALPHVPLSKQPMEQQQVVHRQHGRPPQLQRWRVQGQQGGVLGALLVAAMVAVAAAMAGMQGHVIGVTPGTGHLAAGWVAVTVTASGVEKLRMNELGGNGWASEYNMSRKAEQLVSEGPGC